jgi:hypothetical protein
MTTASSLPARPESTAYMIAVTSRIFALDLGGLRRSLVSVNVASGHLRRLAPVP